MSPDEHVSVMQCKMYEFEYTYNIISYLYIHSSTHLIISIK